MCALIVWRLFKCAYFWPSSKSASKRRQLNEIIKRHVPSGSIWGTIDASPVKASMDRNNSVQAKAAYCRLLAMGQTLRPYAMEGDRCSDLLPILGRCWRKRRRHWRQGQGGHIEDHKNVIPSMEISWLHNPMTPLPRHLQWSSAVWPFQWQSS